VQVGGDLLLGVLPDRAWLQLLVVEHHEAVGDRHGHALHDVLHERHVLLLEHVELAVFHRHELFLLGLGFPAGLFVECARQTLQLLHSLPVLCCHH